LTYTGVRCNRGTEPYLSFSIRTIYVEIVYVYAIAIIVIAAIVYTVFIYLSEIIKKITNKDHDAALALLEDLKDIKLLYFSSSSIATK